MVIGGPPCQGFSNLGTRDPGDPRNRLWREYVRVVTHARPKMFVIENVDRFRSSHEFGLLEEELRSGELQDYRIDVGILNAADFGVPQRRRRTIVVGSRIGNPACQRHCSIGTELPGPRGALSETPSGMFPSKPDRRTCPQARSNSSDSRYRGTSKRPTCI